MSDSQTVGKAARRYALFILAVVYMFNFVDRQILAILLPAIRDEFQVGDTILGLLAGTAFALFYVTMGVPIARLADRVNRRNLIAYALAVWSGMTALSGLAANMWHLTLARVGVGIGEAGCSPPAHSMIADYYPPDKRNTAMGIYTLGISAGIMLAYLAGGWVAQNIGWREAFFIVGIPGLVLALIVRVTLVEPKRGSSEQRTDSGRQPTLREVFTFLLRQRSFVHMAMGAGLSSFVGYSVISFMPSFLVRSFAMPVAEIGVWLGLIIGIAGGLGFWGGGYVSDLVGKQDRGRALRMIAAAMMISWACYFVVFLSPSYRFGLVAFILPTVFSNVYLAPVLSETQGLVALRMRAVASSLMLLIINVVGLMIGPPATGALSDVLVDRFADDSMRYALLVMCVIVLPWAAVHYVLGARTINADLALAKQHD